MPGRGTIYLTTEHSLGIQSRQDSVSDAKVVPFRAMPSPSLLSAASVEAESFVVTERMIWLGVDALVRHQGDDDCRALVRQVFLAMLPEWLECVSHFEVAG